MVSFMAQVPLSMASPGVFAYDPLRPTYYTEFFSWALHDYQSRLSAAGASQDVDTVSHADKVAALAAFSSSLETWSGSAVSALTDFLTGADDAASPVIPDFPALPEVLENAVSLLPGGKIGLVVKALVPVVKGWFSLHEKLRPKDPVRLLDKALLKDSWFLPGYRKSWLEEISEKLNTIGSRSITIDLQPLVDVLSAQDCNNTQVSIAQVLFRALGECREIGGGYSAYYGIFEALEQIANALSCMSIEVETEKAARVKMSGIECQETIPYPSNL